MADNAPRKNPTTADGQMAAPPFSTRPPVTVSVLSHLMIVSSPDILLFIIQFIKMKKIFFAVILFTTQHLFAQQTTPSAVLTAYYGVKDALVADDPDAAAEKAGEFLKVLGSIDLPLKEKLAFDARHISEKKEIAHQREHFGSLSVNMLIVAKKVKLSPQPVYQEYCPMKKASWLSSDSAIRNPYYGNAMLTCGKVQTTIKP
jgi:hypothetical protein